MERRKEEAGNGRKERESGGKTYGDDFGPDERERGLRHDRPPSEEAPLRARDARILCERPRVLPVAEADAVVVRAAAQVEHDAEDDQAGDRDDLDGREDELGLAVGAWRLS